MNILISGGTGYIGSRLIETYSCHKYLIISRKDHPSTVGKEFIPISSLTQKRIDAFRPEIFIHLAADSSFDVSGDRLPEMLRANVELPTTLLELFVRAGGRRVINTGTYWQHRKNKLYSPNSFYAATKQSFEDVLDYYVMKDSVFVQTLKLFDTYGPHDPRKKIFRLVYEAAQSSQPLDLSGGEQLLNLIHVTDVLHAYEIAMGLMGSGHERNLVKGPPLPLRQIIELFCEINQLHPILNWGERPYGPRDFFEEVDIFPLLPGWAPKIPLTDGLKDLFKD